MVGVEILLSSPFGGVASLAKFQRVKLAVSEFQGVFFFKGEDKNFPTPRFFFQAWTALGKVISSWHVLSPKGSEK